MRGLFSLWSRLHDIDTGKGNSEHPSHPHARVGAAAGTQSNRQKSCFCPMETLDALTAVGLSIIERQKHILTVSWCDAIKLFHKIAILIAQFHGGYNCAEVFP